MLFIAGDDRLPGRNERQQLFHLYPLFFSNGAQFVCHDSLSGCLHLCGIVHFSILLSIKKRRTPDVSVLRKKQYAATPYVGITHIRL